MLAGCAAFIRLSIWKPAIYEEKKKVSVPCIAHSLYNCVSALAGWFNRNECEIISKDESTIAVGDIVSCQITSGISNPFLLTKLSVPVSL